MEWRVEGRPGDFGKQTDDFMGFDRRNCDFIGFGRRNVVLWDLIGKLWFCGI